MLKAEDMPRNNDKTNWHKQKGTIRQGGILWIDASKHTHTHQRGGAELSVKSIFQPLVCGGGEKILFAFQKYQMPAVAVLHVFV
jgi:hypothetical protein